MTKFIKCGECMKGAPYGFCCKVDCGKRKRCENCTSPARGDHCPNDDLYFADDESSDDQT